MSSNAKNAQEMISKAKLVTCKRCGMANLAWVQSTVTGKWFLAPTTDRKLWVSEDGDRSLPKGYVLAIKMRPHRCGEAEQKAERDQAISDDYRHNERVASGEMAILCRVYEKIASDPDAVELLKPLMMDAIKRYMAAS